MFGPRQRMDMACFSLQPLGNQIPMEYMGHTQVAKMLSLPAMGCGRSRTLTWVVGMLCKLAAFAVLQAHRTALERCFPGTNMDHMGWKADSGFDQRCILGLNALNLNPSGESVCKTLTSFSRLCRQILMRMPLSMLIVPSLRLLIIVVRSATARILRMSEGVRFLRRRLQP